MMPPHQVAPSDPAQSIPWMAAAILVADKILHFLLVFPRERGHLARLR